MKTSFVASSALAITIALTATAQAQRPPRGGRGGPGGPPPMNLGGEAANNLGPQLRGGQNADQADANQIGANQDNAGQNMPRIDQLAQMMIANFDANGSGGLEQQELQSALTALRGMMQNQNNGQNQRQGNPQGIAADAQNQVRRGGFVQNNQALDGNAQTRPPRGPGNGGVNHFRGAGRGR